MFGADRCAVNFCAVGFAMEVCAVSYFLSDSFSRGPLSGSIFWVDRFPVDLWAVRFSVDLWEFLVPGGSLSPGTLVVLLFCVHLGCWISVGLIAYWWTYVCLRHLTCVVSGTVCRRWLYLAIRAKL